MCQSTGFLKTIAFFINFLLLLAGLALLVIGVVVHVKTNALNDVVETGFYEFGPVATMVVGGGLFLLGLLGCCGAIRESRWILITYSIFILVLMICKLALAVAVYFYSDAVVHYFREHFSITFITKRYAFSVVETTLGCCGLNGPLDYVNPTLPGSCCAGGGAGGVCVLVDANPGCLSVVGHILHNSTTAITCVCIAVAGLELLAVLFVLYLAKNLRNKKSVF